MLFSEVHSAYFQAVSRILDAALKGPVSPRHMDEIVRETAFAESVLVIGPALRSGAWPLLASDGRALVHSAATMPLTALEKRWLKALTLDPRIALFDPPIGELFDVEPLFDPNDVYWFDRYLDGDPYDDPEYIAHFRTVLEAIRTGHRLNMIYASKGRNIRGTFVPGHLEYSGKDDKFRLTTLGGRRNAIRMSSVVVCELDRPFHRRGFRENPSPKQRTLELEILDERKAMERVMLHFSHFRKEAERIDQDRYRMVLWYEPEDETEMVIRILSFGPMVRVVQPEGVRRQVVERLEGQVRLL